MVALNRYSWLENRSSQYTYSEKESSIVDSHTLLTFCTKDHCQCNLVSINNCTSSNVHMSRRNEIDGDYPQDDDGLENVVSVLGVPFLTAKVGDT